MPSVILAGTTTGTALSLTSDTSGELQIQTNNGATTAMTLTTGGAAVFTAGTVSAPAITTTGDTNTGIFFPAADTIAFTEGGAESMRIDSSGNLGIGTTPSVNSLSSSGYKSLELGNVAGSGLLCGLNESYVQTNTYFNSGWKYANTAASAQYLQQAGAHIWNNAVSGTAGNALTWTERMRIDSAGNVGIGTSVAPGANGGGLAIYRSDYPRLTFRNSTTGDTTADGTTMYQIGNNWEMVNLESGYLSFGTSNTERMRIDSSGRLLVNTSDSGANVQMRLNFVGSAVNGFRLEDTAASGSPYMFLLTTTAKAANNTQTTAAFTDTSATRWEFRANGGLSNYQANNVNLSDEREKTNIKLAANYLDKICAIPVKTFNYIDQNLEEDDGLTLGVIAQDVEAVAPELVMESDWSKEKNGSKMRLSIYQTDLQYALMKAIQEQQALIENLTTRLNALEGK
jgi:hypothetical protein